MFRDLKRKAYSNFHLLLGVLIGLYISTLLSAPQCHNTDITQQQQQQKNGANGVTKVALRLDLSTPGHNNNNVSRKLVTAKKTKPIRPRYYSTELGIREKLFVGILTSEEKINSQAVHLNATIGHLIDKVKFFITAQNKLKTKFNLTGIVGFTDTRHKYKPFQIVKYISDSFLLDYDYYFLINDYSYINVRALKDLVSKISVSMNVYLGTPVPESSFCNLDAGIVISNSVLKAMKENLDWCVSNAVSDDHSENFGRCVYHSIKLDCQQSVQGQTLNSFKIKHFELDKHLNALAKNPNFTKAITVYPILQHTDFYRLNAFFAKQRLMQLKKQTVAIAKSLGDDESWPPGQRGGNKAATRFDVLRQVYFNMTHMFFPDDFVNVRKHSQTDLEDIKRILDAVKAHTDYKHLQKYKYAHFVNGYRKFDLSRGMDYELDLAFTDLTTGKETIKRFEVCKPLGKVEFVPTPYVTENSRVNVILPVQEFEKEEVLDFFTRYVKSVIETKDKSFLLLVLLYQFESPSKGAADVFYGVKNAALKMLNRKTSEEAKVAWVSIRLPKTAKNITLLDYPALNFAIVDLALRKLGLDSLNLMVDVYSDISVEFLNRVRMNTIVGVQIFNAIPFRQYDPKITQNAKLEVNKNVGHFDREEYRYVSFYSKDYVTARKKSQNTIPIIKSDNDIGKILEEGRRWWGNIFELFVRFGDEELHSMRATEPSLRVKYHEEGDATRENLFLGNKAQLAALILSKKEHISEI